MNMEGINTSLVDNTELLYEAIKTSSVSKGGISEEKVKEQKIRNEKQNQLFLCHGMNEEKWTECMKQFVRDQTSADNLKSCIKDALEATYREAVKSGCLDESNQKQFFNSEFFSMKVAIEFIAEGANTEEGWRVARSYGISESRCIYYNAEYYYRHEEMGQILRDCFNELAEEKGMGDLKNEEYYARKAKPGAGFNSLWNCQHKNIKMINTEADPPRNFVFFYGENWETSKEVLYVNGEGISSGSGETLELSGSQEEKGKHFNFLDFIKSKYEGQEELWERLHYLKNFRIYSLKRMLLNY